jgi:uncharacterized protein
MRVKGLAMNSLYKLSPFTTLVREQDAFTLVYWGAYNEPLVYSIDDPSHPIYEIIAKPIDLFPFFPEKHANDFASLLNDGVIVSESWDRQSAIDEYLKAIHNPKHLHLILLPAGTACNCSCLYCGQDHNGKGMSWEFEGDAIVKFIKNRAPDTLHIEFFGGEPLCALPFIEQLCSGILDICHSTGMLFHGSMTTNGTLLTPDVFDKLLQLQITEYQITIDGVEEHHNRLRPLRNGNNSYQTIIQNLKQFKESEGDYSVTLRMNFDTLSAENEAVTRHLTELNSWIKTDRRFKLRFRPAYDWGGAIETKTLCSKMQAPEFTSKLNKTTAMMGFSMADVSMWGVGGHACYAGRENSFVIEPGLKIKKCTVSEDDNNIVGHISVDGKLETNQYLDKWVNNGKSLDRKCTKCELLPVCMNVACPLMRLSLSSNKNCIKSDVGNNEIVKFIKLAI